MEKILTSKSGSKNLFEFCLILYEIPQPHHATLQLGPRREIQMIGVNSYLNTSQI